MHFNKEKKGKETPMERLLGYKKYLEPSVVDYSICRRMK